ncbi:MAG: hypothetical protein N5P05_001083 [Chroococcopsis gigantea SAG 12.99]|jgi:hypothetical protein|nr:GAF domain-containing sensor histidine kinase [Chlorogloea purpurea SAG 13.99]MDV2999477.1 hypothetical protein [Chroococcopsis gigantea SAG 12.99]
MPHFSNRIFCRLDGLTPAVREQQRVSVLNKLGLLDAESVPVFDEATQTAARFLGAPICILGLMVHQQLCLKSAVGLSLLGLMNNLAASRKIPRDESYCTYVVDSQQTIVIEDTFSSGVFAGSILAQHYGIRAYLGTPLITNEGWCIGSLAVMDSTPRNFTTKDVESLNLIARWCLREFERDYLLKMHSDIEPHYSELSYSEEINPAHYSIGDIKLKLLKGLTERLRTPLTSIIGMSSILRSEVFGSLTQKQKEYTKIIHNSGTTMNALVDEILKLGTGIENNSHGEIAPVNLEIICHQIVNDLIGIAQDKKLELSLTVEQGAGIWLLSREKVHQCIYYLLISLIRSVEPRAEIKINLSHRHNNLQVNLWSACPWQADNHSPPYLPPMSLPLNSSQESGLNGKQEEDGKSYLGVETLNIRSLEATLAKLDNISTADSDNYQILLGLLLAGYLADAQNGKILVQNSSESVNRYTLILPKIPSPAGE